MRTEKEKMLAGELYRADSPELQADNAITNAWLNRYNASLALTVAERHNMLAEMFAEVGEGARIRPPFYCDYGYNIKLGSGAFLNFNCVILDIVEVSIGGRTQIGPGCRSSPPITLVIPCSETLALSSVDLCGSGATSGSGPAR